MAFSHPFSFDPCYGYDLEGLLNITPPAPFPGFETFWRETYAEAIKVPARLEVGPSDFEVAGYTVYEARFDAWDPAPGVIRRLGGWLLVPDEKPVCAIVQSHGYGGPGEAPGVAPGSVPAVRLLYSTRGFGLSIFEDIPSNSSAFHVIHKIESKEHYVLRGCAADIWASASALIEYAPELASTLYYLGGSFGGGIGALAVPWDARFKRVYWHVPTFGHHPIRVLCECGGSGESVRIYHRRRPEVMEVLRYFDAATAASFLKAPALVSCALFDPAVPPPGQFAVYNAIQSCKELVVEPAGHFEYPEEKAVSEVRERRINVWFSPSAGI